MHLSKLQKYILKQAFAQGPRCPRAVFESFYDNVGEQEIKVITVSIERLILKGFLKGYGYKTAEKLFIEYVTLTPAGRKEARRLFDDEQKLPFGGRTVR